MKRQSSVPPGSDTAKAKQAKAQSDEKDKKAGVGKGRIPSIPKQELSAIAVTLAARVQTVAPSLKPKHYRTIRNLASEWYKEIYHTKFQLTKAAYLQYSVRDCSKELKRPKKQIRIIWNCLSRPWMY